MAKKKQKNYATGKAEKRFEERPVTKSDKWCRFKSRLKESELYSEAPYGYIVVVPNYYDWMHLDINGIIIKSKLFKGQLYLQVIRKGNRDYLTRVKTMEGMKKRKGKRKSKKVIFRYMNIRNLDKDPLK